MLPGVKVPLVPVYQELLNAELDDGYEKAVKELGGTYAGGLYAACAMAAHEMAAATSYRCLNPVHSRWSDEWVAAMGWFINLVPLHVDIEPDDTFGSLARRTRQEFRDTKAAGDVPTLRVAEILSEYMDFDADSSDRPPIMSYLDGTMIPGHEKWLEQNFWGLTGAGDDDDVYVWMMRMPGSTYVTASCPDTPQAVHAVTSYFARVAEILQEVARTGGDVPMGPAAHPPAPRLPEVVSWNSAHPIASTDPLDQVSAAFLDPDAHVGRYGLSGGSGDRDPERVEAGAMTCSTLTTVQNGRGRRARHRSANRQGHQHDHHDGTVGARRDGGCTGRSDDGGEQRSRHGHDRRPRSRRTAGQCVRLYDRPHARDEGAVDRRPVRHPDAAERSWRSSTQSLRLGTGGSPAPTWREPGY
jgi:hypothetical protein